MKKKCFILIADAGNGHRSCAESLKLELYAKQPEMEIEILNPNRVILKSNAEDFYNRYICGNHLYFLTPFLIFFVKILFKIMHKKIVKKMTLYFKKNRPDLVISVMPYINGACREALNRIDPKISFCVVITDWSDSLGMWLDEVPNQHIFCNTPHAKKHAEKLGHPLSHIHALSGMILKREFYQKKWTQQTKDQFKIQLGFDPQKLTILMMYGIGNIRDTVQTFYQMSIYAKDIQVLLLCGHDQELFKAIHTTSFSLSVKPIPYDEHPFCYFQIADLFVGKPGPGSLAEAMHMQLPIITERNFNTVAQEVFNAQHVENTGTGVVVKDMTKELPQTIGKILDPSFYIQLKKNVIKKENQGIFELIKVIETLL